MHCLLSWFFFFIIFLSRAISDDECYNDEWADCMGFDLHRLGELEVEFLNALEWKCHVDVDQFATVLKQVEVELALSQQSKSGLFTYNTARNLDIMGKYLKLKTAFNVTYPQNCMVLYLHLQKPHMIDFLQKLLKLKYLLVS